MSRLPKQFIALMVLLGLFVWGGAERTPQPSLDLDPDEAPMSVGTEENPNALAEMEFLMLRDPRTNTIPRGMRRREMGLANRLPIRGPRLQRSALTGTSLVHSLTWTERGPNNVPGRTRALAVDVTHPTTLLAAGVSGGIWRSTDEGATWSLRTARAHNHSIACIAQDRRFGRTDTWYAGTGEVRGSTTNATRWGALYRGDGVFKSIDNGLTWSQLPATVSGTPHLSDHFDYVNSIATNPANLIEDEVLAATYRGLYRSTDGGDSWSLVLPSDSGYTDVAIGTSGVMIAHTHSGGPRVWRSVDGTNWTLIQPASFPTTAIRVSIAIAESNPSVAYFLVTGADNAPQVNGIQFWKYTYVSGDGSGVGGTWENRSASFPAQIGTQTGYCQGVIVKPDDENFVVVGGLVIYFSTTGFATPTEAVSADYHIDQHSGAFNRSDPRIFYAAHDGGISRFPNVVATPGEAIRLMNGYNTTQFYSVCLGREAGSNMILGGAQDNSNQLGNAPGSSAWVFAGGGDGTISEISPAASNRLYSQGQSGSMSRRNWDLTNVVNIAPTGAINAMFVNPMVLDPNDPLLLYWSAGSSTTTSHIWRNNNAPSATTTVGWTSLAATDVGAASGYLRTISALGLSTANDPNVLYYGTIDGIVKKVVDAHGATPVVTTITPPGLNGGTSAGGFVRCIAVDPNDSDRALLVFGNYRFPSLWYTTNGGTIWTDVEGNIGGDDGPAIRWATMCDLDGQIEVFLGTSIGVLSTNALNGASTLWSQEAANEIGNIAVPYMDYRASDRTLAVATHGRGIFTTQLTGTTGIPARRAVVGDGPTLGRGRPNPARHVAMIPFDLPHAADVSLRVFDIAGREVATLVEGPRDRGHHEVPFSVSRLVTGNYYCVLRAGETVATQKVVVRR